MTPSSYRTAPLRKHPRSIAFPAWMRSTSSCINRAWMCPGGDFITYISYSARGGERRRPANELCGVMAMKYSSVRSIITTAQPYRPGHADIGLSEAGVRTEKQPEPRLHYRTVSAKLPGICNTGCGRQKILTPKVWGEHGCTTRRKSRMPPVVSPDTLRRPFARTSAPARRRQRTDQKSPRSRAT